MKANKRLLNHLSNKEAEPGYWFFCFSDEEKFGTHYITLGNAFLDKDIKKLIEHIATQSFSLGVEAGAEWKADQIRKSIGVK